MKHTKLTTLLIASATLSTLQGAEPTLKTVPSVAKWTASQGKIDASTIASVNVTKNTPELSKLQQLFTKELAEKTKTAANGVKINLNLNTALSKNKEAYEVSINDKEIKITGASPAALYYGTRTLLQLLQQSTTLEKGTIKDAPTYPVRSVLLDVGRKFMPVEELKDWIRMMGWMKLNELHFHLNDNSWGRYPGYRLESKKFPGLASKDGHYTFAQIRELQDFAKLHGVVIIPELDTPGHSLALTHYRPELAHPQIDRKGFGLAYLDVNNPEAVQFVKDLWDEVIPHFDANIVHIGTDEYRYRLIKGKKAQQQIGEQFRLYINDLASHIETKHKKNVRMWSGFEHLPGKTQPKKSIIIDMWETSDAKVKVNDGYRVVNSSHYYTYIVPGAPYYGVNNSFIYNDWTPMQFSGKPEGQLSPEDPGLMGGKLHVWNDFGPTGYTWNEIARLTAPSMASMGEKLWGTKGAKNYAIFNNYAKPLYTSIPNVNLLTRKATVNVTNNILWQQTKPSIHIANTNPELNLKSENLEYPWTASFTITRHNDIAGNETLISSDLAAFYLDLSHTTEDKKTKKKVIKRGVACVRANQAPGWEPLLSYRPDILVFDYQMPVNEKVTLTFVGEKKKTSLYVNGKHKQSINIQMVCPLKRLGHPLPQGFHGTIHKASIKTTAPYNAKLTSWTPSTVTSEKKTHTLKLNKYLKEAGNLTVSFNYTNGNHRLDIHEVAILENGKIISKDTHHGFAGSNQQKNKYTLQLGNYDNKKNYELQYTIHSDGGTDSNGEIRLQTQP